jgi:hypothetical protein
MAVSEREHPFNLVLISEKIAVLMRRQTALAAG